MYNGTRGPGTLEITTLIGGRWRLASPDREYRRMKPANGAGGVSSDHASSISAPSAFCTSLAPLVTSWTWCRRSRASVMLTGTDVNMFETLLPLRRPESASVWVDVGTPATSGRSRTPPCLSRYSRRAPAHTASTTSLTVHPTALPVAFTSGSDNDVNAKMRRGVNALLKGAR